ncbi:MAG: transglycosylase SLT domain-containing protein [Shewanella sp.]|nr:transglycosylase SLT domain-containing protein [Shewanella sp.]MCF1437423.1 transglycosylase SLT domain-containing protein [Shewanella sp.]
MKSILAVDAQEDRLNMRRQLVGILGTISLYLIGVTDIRANTLSPSQQTYLNAKQALDDGDRDKYLALRAALGDYPLNIYLDYHDKQADIYRQSGPHAAVSLTAFAQTPLYTPLKHRYLQKAGAQSRWEDFLAISPQLPRNTKLQCYFYRAKMQTGDTELAWKGARQLWLYGYSRPKACDPLFTAWTKAGHRSQELIWQRMLLAFNAGQHSLLHWLSRKITGQKAQAEALLKLYRDPRKLRHTSDYMAKGASWSDLVAAGLTKLSHKDLPQTITLYDKYRKAGRFSDYQIKKLRRTLVRRALLTQEESLAGYVDSQLAAIGSDDLVEMRLRWAIRNGDQQTVKQILPLLTDTGKATARWRYWQAMALPDQASRDAALSKLAGERSFYGFLAANMLNKPIALNSKEPKALPDMQAKLSQDPAWLRIIELQALDKPFDVRTEWKQLLMRSEPQAWEQLTLMASDRQWHAMGVEGTIHGKLWDHVSQRFPFAHDAQFKSAAKSYRVNANELRAIARRESAFFSHASSRVGARGLMQLMPATAKQTSRKHKLNYRKKVDLYDVPLNVTLGSAYYSGLLERFDNNRILATAAYNAGPHRVTAWLERTNNQLDAISFIESIPFRETREYVQAVFSYRLIYEQLANNTAPPLLSDAEQAHNY